MTPESVLVTGASGYLGSRIAEDLVLKGYEVRGLDIFPPGKASIQSKRYGFFKADITRPETFPFEIRQASILIHCAALVHRKSPDLSRENYFRVNHVGTRNLLLALDPKQLRHVVFLSTVSVYGEVSQGSVPDEQTPPKPIDDYGESKLAAEEEIRSFSRKYSISHTIFRLAPVYDRDFLRNLKKRVYLPKCVAFYQIGEGKQRLSLCAAKNVVYTVNQSLAHGIGLNGTFIIKDRIDYPIREIIDIMKRFRNEPFHPVIRVPKALPLCLVSGLRHVMPEKGSYIAHQLQKIISDNIYSGQKLQDAGVDLPWDMPKALLAS